jgi:hypothetical protein
MTPEPSTSRPGGPLAPVASYRHTAILAGAFLLLAAAGAVFQSAPAPNAAGDSDHPNVIPLYLSLLVAEWGLLYYVWKAGLRRSGSQLRDLIGGRWIRGLDVLRDLLLAGAVWLLWLGVQRGCDLWLGPGRERCIDAYLPRGPAEVALWIALSLSAGFSEEVVFRGYFQRQFAALTRSRLAGLLMQGLLFGISHGYQGPGAALRITLFGLLFGGLALWLRSLRPGIAAHAWTDLYAGWLSLLK